MALSLTLAVLLDVCYVTSLVCSDSVGNMCENISTVGAMTRV